MTAETARRRLLTLLLCCVLTLCGGCSTWSRKPATNSTGSTPPGPTLSWVKVTLPEDAAPSTLSTNGAELLVGAQVSSGRIRPRLFSVTAAAEPRVIRLAPQSPYAFRARFLSVSAADGRLTAVGGAPGGAHSNTRWTTWTGTRAGLRETPQSFYTFGGYGAGSLVGSTVTGRGPALAGSWEGAETRLDGAVWLPRGETWVRQPSTGTALESTPSLLVGLRSVTSSGDRLVAPGSVVRLEPGSVSQTAAVWRSDAQSRGWVRIDLPDAEPPSEAVTAECSTSECVVAGYAHGAYALWRLTPDGAVRVAGVPPLPVADGTPIPVPLTRGDRTIAVVSTGTTAAVLVGGSGGWTRTDGPTGVPSSAALVGGERLYVVARATDSPAVLWRADVRALG